jgi:phosphate/sulfate permease
MKSVRGLLDLKHRKSLRLAILLLSTLSILSASALAYARVVYERALNVGSIGGVTTGSGSTTSGGVTLAPATILILAALVFVIGLSVLALLRKVSRRVGKTTGGPGSSPTNPVPTLPGEDEWEESPTKEEGEE